MLNFKRHASLGAHFGAASQFQGCCKVRQRGSQGTRKGPRPTPRRPCLYNETTSDKKPPWVTRKGRPYHNVA